MWVDDYSIINTIFGYFPQLFLVEQLRKGYFFFSFLAARFSIKDLAGFFLVSFFVSLDITVSFDEKLNAYFVSPSYYRVNKE
jgi:hypothetical protein